MMSGSWIIITQGSCFSSPRSTVKSGDRTSAMALRWLSLYATPIRSSRLLTEVTSSLLETGMSFFFAARVVLTSLTSFTWTLSPNLFSNPALR